MAIAPAPAAAATKTPKNKGLSIYNHVALALPLVPVIVTTTLFTSVVQKTKAQKDVQDEIQTLIEQEDALAALAWCVQVTPDNTNKVDELYSTYDRMSSAAQEAVKKECKDRVDAVQLLESNDTENVFTIGSTCELGDTQTTLHCSVDVSPASDMMKTKFEAFQTTDPTPKIWFDESQFVLGTPDHVADDVAATTMTKDEKVSVDFTFPPDTSWGSHYKVEVVKYFSNT